MPRRSQGPRLYLDRKRGSWVIRDGRSFVRTGCPERCRVDAERALEHYIGKKHRPQPSPTPLIADVLAAYAREHAPHTRSAPTIAHTVANLARWWADKKLADVTAANCRAYAAGRPAVAARRDLESLRAAIGYWHKEYGPLPSVPAVTLPAKPASRERWLTRGEAARLLWAARRVQHLARFILLGLYTGSRAGALLAIEWDWVDLERGVMRRRAIGETESMKRRPPVRLGRKLLGHLRRWRKNDPAGIRRVCHYHGQPVRKLRRSWKAAVARAELDGKVTPHTLRHTRATWLMQNRIDPWEAAGHLGMSLATLTRTYGHHHPDWQKDAAEV